MNKNLNIVAGKINICMFFMLLVLTTRGLTQDTLWFENFNNGYTLTFSPETSDNRWVVNNSYIGGVYMALGMWPVTIPNIPDQPPSIIGFPHSKYLHISNMDDGLGGGVHGSGITSPSFIYGFGSSNEDAISPNIPTTGFKDIKVSYWWLCEGGSDSKGTVSYSIDGGNSWTVLASHFGSAQWNSASHNLPATVNNQANFKLKINWADAEGDDPPMCIDDIIVIGTPTTQNMPQIEDVVLSATPLCEKKANDNYIVTFTASNVFSSVNQFFVEISDATGSFSTPIQIGTLTESTAGTKTIMCNIPATLAYSTNYKIRVRSTAPVIEVAVPVVVHPFPKFVKPIPLADLVLPSCNSDDGSIKVTAIDGTVNYNFNMVPLPENATQTNAGSMHFFKDLPSGVYTVYVKDGSDATCQDTVVVDLLSIGVPKVTSSSTNISCYGKDDGSITIMATNGLPPFVHTLKDSEGNVVDTETVSSVNSTIIYEDLSEGTYTATVMDQNNCPFVKEFKIVEPDSFVLKVIAYDANCGTNTGAIAWEISGGTGNLSISLNGTLQTHSDTITKLLSPDDYIVKLVDSLGCSKDTTVTIKGGDGGVLDSADVQIVHSGCNGPCSGSLVAYSPTATTYTLNNVTNNTGIFNNLCHGSYNLLVSNGTGCDITQPITIMSVDSPVADFGYTPSKPTTFSPQVTFLNYSLYATKYDWTISDVRTGYSFTTNDASFSHTFVSPDSNMYHVCLTASNEYNCSSMICKDIFIQDEIMLFIPNTFTPDDNEYNQTWKITAIGIDSQNFTLEVYNRWGEMIYESHDYSVNWDATYDGVPVGEGMYSWRIIVKDPINDYKKVYTGNLNIIR